MPRPVADSSRIEHAERLELSERDSERVLMLLESPPEPNSKLRAAARLLDREALLVWGLGKGDLQALAVTEVPEESARLDPG